MYVVVKVTVDPAFVVISVLWPRWMLIVIGVWVKSELECMGGREGPKWRVCKVVISSSGNCLLDTRIGEREVLLVVVVVVFFVFVFYICY